MRFLGSNADQPESVEIEAVVIRADGSREELGTVAYAHRNPLRTLLAQRRVRGGSVLRSLVGRGPKVK